MKKFLKSNWIFILVFASFWILLTVIRVYSYYDCDVLNKYCIGDGKPHFPIFFAIIKFSLFLIILFAFEKIEIRKTIHKKFKILIIVIIIPLILLGSIISSYVAASTREIKKEICSKSTGGWDITTEEYVLESKNLRLEEYEFIRVEFQLLNQFPILPNSSKEINFKCVNNVISGDIFYIDFSCDFEESNLMEGSWNIIAKDSIKSRITIKHVN
jgi:hypothetical protein